MSCAELRPLLEAYVDGDLAEDRRQQVALHLPECAGCRGEVESLLALAAESRRRLGPVEPERDLWPGVSGRIRDSERAARRRQWGAGWLAAAALVGFVAGAFLMRSADTRPAPIATAAVPAPDVPLAEWEHEARRHRAELLVSFSRQRDRLPAESMAVIEENLRVIDDAIHEIRTALVEDPQNPQLNFLLASAYQQEIQLLKRLARV